VAATSIASLRMFPPVGIIERVVGYSAQHMNRNSPDELWNGVDDSKWRSVREVYVNCPCLAEFDRHRFGVITGRALKGSLVVIDLIGWLDA